MALVNEFILKEEILEIIKTAKENHLYSYAYEGILGLESEIEGTDDFLKEINDKLDILLK